MKFKYGFNVGYNVQTAVDSKHHLIAAYAVTNHPSDNGLIAPVIGEVKKVFNLNILEVVLDKGYRDKQDMINCLEQGIVPNVMPAKKLDYFELETNYESCEVLDVQKKSSKPSDLKACLRAGVVSEVYEKFVKDISVVEVSVFENVIVEEPPKFNSEEEMVEYARGGFFVRDLKRNVVFCLGGERLRFCGSSKKRKSDGGGVFGHYCNKLGCERCLVKCCRSKFFVAYFGEGQVVVGCGSFGVKGVRWCVRRRVGVRKVVRFKFFPDVRKLVNRKCLSEYPFGGLKFWNDGFYFLFRGSVKVSGVLVLSFLAYNVKRAVAVLGFGRVVEVIRLGGSFFVCFFVKVLFC